ncbi:MAG: hypothetical protein PHO63_05550, partial [Bacilli bacterium]|nr:hypothetical protein [Bacilli bacterium]
IETVNAAKTNAINAMAGVLTLDQELETFINTLTTETIENFTGYNVTLYSDTVISQISGTGAMVKMVENFPENINIISIAGVNLSGLTNVQIMQQVKAALVSKMELVAGQGTASTLLDLNGKTLSYDIVFGLGEVTKTVTFTVTYQTSDLGLSPEGQLKLDNTRTLLSNQIAYVEGLNNDNYDYPEETWTVLMTALSNANLVNNDLNSTLEDLNIALETLYNATDLTLDSNKIVMGVYNIPYDTPTSQTAIDRISIFVTNMIEYNTKVTSITYKTSNTSEYYGTLDLYNVELTNGKVTATITVAVKQLSLEEENAAIEAISVSYTIGEPIKVTDSIPGITVGENQLLYKVVITPQFANLETAQASGRSVNTIFNISTPNVTVYYSFWDGINPITLKSADSTGEGSPYIVGMENHPLSAGNIQEPGDFYILVEDSFTGNINVTIKLVDSEWTYVEYGSQIIDQALN